jgi:hypothetical protein
VMCSRAAARVKLRSRRGHPKAIPQHANFSLVNWSSTAAATLPPGRTPQIRSSRVVGQRRRQHLRACVGSA